jgi:hypothetical protein
MEKFEAIYKQPSAFVSGAAKSLPQNLIWHVAKFGAHAVVGILTHTGKVVWKFGEEVISFAWETLKDLRNEISEGFNDILEAGITEAEQAEKATKIALGKLVTTDVEDSVLVGHDLEDLDMAFL